jgi:ubiquinone/menaquinone biosynthesis C-methylase UbiE
MADALTPPARAAAFDEAAVSYDSEFAGTTAGSWLRESVWSRLAPFVKPGMRALDLGCGTGEDALWLARSGCHVTAADGSPAMLQQVAAKASRSNFEQAVRIVRLDLNAPSASLPFTQSFDVVVSNFGAINCVTDLPLLGHKLAAWVKPGGTLALIFMGRFCAWETAYYLARLDRNAARRWSGRALASVGQETVEVRYWSRAEMLNALRPSFRLLAAHGIGTLLPPSYLFHWVERRPRFFSRLARWERRMSNIWPLSRMGDHTLIVARRLDRAQSGGSSR